MDGWMDGLNPIHFQCMIINSCKFTTTASAYSSCLWSKGRLCSGLGSKPTCSMTLCKTQLISHIIQNHPLPIELHPEHVRVLISYVPHDCDMESVQIAVPLKLTLRPKQISRRVTEIVPPCEHQSRNTNVPATNAVSHWTEAVRYEKSLSWKKHRPTGETMQRQ